MKIDDRPFGVGQVLPLNPTRFVGIESATIGFGRLGEVQPLGFSVPVKRGIRQFQRRIFALSGDDH